MESSNRPAPNGPTAAAAVRQPVLPERAVDVTSGEIEARVARVSELRKQYREGTLQVDARKLASDIVTKHLKK